MHRKSGRQGFTYSSPYRADRIGDIHLMKIRPTASICRSKDTHDDMARLWRGTSPPKLESVRRLSRVWRQHHRRGSTILRGEAPWPLSSTSLIHDIGSTQRGQHRSDSSSKGKLTIFTDRMITLFFPRVLYASWASLTSACSTVVLRVYRLPSSEVQ